MWIFIKGIPAEMGSRALQRFVKRLLFPDWLPFDIQGRVRITGSKILKIVHVQTQSVEYHGLIQVLPASKAESVMQRLNKAKIGGRQLQSHPYNRRLTRLDRGGTDSDRASAEPPPHFRERRRNHLVSQVVDASLQTRV